MFFYFEIIIAFCFCYACSNHYTQRSGYGTSTPLSSFYNTSNASPTDTSHMWGTASPAALSPPEYESKGGRLPDFTKLTSQGYSTPARNTPYNSIGSYGQVSPCSSPSLLPDCFENSLNSQYESLSRPYDLPSASAYNSTTTVAGSAGSRGRPTTTTHLPTCKYLSCFT